MADRIAESITSDYLTCCICCELYVDPRQLPCTHSFCFKCLVDCTKKVLIAEKTCLPCPLCRKEFQAPSQHVSPSEWARLYPVDTLCVSFLEALTHHQETVLKTEEETAVLSRQTSVHSWTCSQHRDKTLEVYCHEHREVICSECAWREHRLGKCQCLSIEEAYQRFEPKFVTLKHLLSQQLSTVDEIKPERRETQTGSLQQSKLDAFDQISELETRIQDFWIVAQKQLKDLRLQVTELYEECQVENSSDVEFMISGLRESFAKTHLEFRELCETKDKVKLLSQLSVFEEYVAAQQKQLDKLTSKDSSDSLTITFTTTPVVDTFLSEGFTAGLSWLGTVQVEKNKQADQEFEAETLEGFVCIQKTCKSDWEEQREICGRLDGEKKCCFSSVLLNQNAVLIADQTNNTVKMFELNTGRFAGEVGITEPYQLSSMTGTSDIAVTQWEMAAITILQTEPELTVKQTIPTEKIYSSICSLGPDTLAASHLKSKSIDILDTKEQTITSIKQDKQGRKLFERPLLLAAASNGAILVGDVKQKQLTCIDQTGNKLWGFNTLFRPSGLCCEGDVVYLCLSTSNRVMSLNLVDGAVIDKEFICVADGIQRPWAISCFEGTIAVTEDCPSDTIHLFQTK